jgi:hypothetical protein
MKEWLDKLDERALPEGGFADRPGGWYRPDATAWAVLALTASGVGEDQADAARMRLQRDQMADGRLCFIADYPAAYWPTALAVMAWHGSPEFHAAQQVGLRFLLSASGRHFKRRYASIIGHDPAIKGWAWIEGTHSWVEPTSLALICLDITGKPQHERACEARRMLLDRQLADGGWNYGNVSVFGRPLRPMPHSTGIALSALAGRVPQESVASSIAYLQKHLHRWPTPFSLSWSILGLSAWDQRPEHAEDRIVQCLSRQTVYGTCDTVNLALLILSFLGKRGLANLIMERT